MTTNKVTGGERAAVPHHLIGTVPAMSEYRVTDYRDDALRVVCVCVGYACGVFECVYACLVCVLERQRVTEVRFLM